MADGQSAEETAAEVKRRFTERSLLFCGAEFLVTKRCLEAASKSRFAPSCDASKDALLQCMSARVCEGFHSRLQNCIAANGADAAPCAQLQAGMTRCLQAAYVSLPEPDESSEVVEARMRALGAAGAL